MLDTYRSTIEFYRCHSESIALMILYVLRKHVKS